MKESSVCFQLVPLFIRIILKLRFLRPFEDWIFNLSERKMWYLLVAAGAGYLATKWQNAQRLRLLCEQNGRTSSPSSPPSTPKRELDSSLSNSMPTSPFSDKRVSSPPQDIKFNKRSTCDAYLVTLVQAKREEDPLMLTSKCSLTTVDNIHNKEEQQLGEEPSSSPSSCCSSSSTVINSPVDSLSVLQRCDGSFKFQGKELGTQSMRHNGVFQFQGKQQNKQPNQTSSSSLNSSIEGDCSRVVSTMRQNQQAEPLHRAVSDSYFSDCTVGAPNINLTAAVSSNAAAATDNRRMLDAVIHTPLSYTGKRQRDDTRADILLDIFVCTQFSKFDAKQDTSQTIARKSGPVISPPRSVASQKVSNQMGDADSDAFVGFGLAMAVCFMVSSSKKETEKMGKVLRETEDLVSEMRKELEERKLCFCMDEEDSDEFFTIKPKDSAHQECNIGVVMNPCDTYVKNGHCLRDAYFEKESDPEEEGENDCTMSLIELERKLWQVFQERQEARILELEGALELALSQLHAKEEELRWWKNRASCLMEQSFRSTSVSTKSHLKRIKGFEWVNEEGVKIEPQFSSVKASLSAVEGGAGIKESCLNLTGHENSSARTSSTCSIGSGESVLSIEVGAFTYPVNQYDGNLQP